MTVYGLLILGIAVLCIGLGVMWVRGTEPSPPEQMPERYKDFDHAIDVRPEGTKH